MNLKLIISILFLTILTFSCSEDETPVVVEDLNHAYMGSWEGTFTGGDVGTWQMEVDKDGKFSGSFTGQTGNIFYFTDGSINETGVITAIIDVNGVTLDFDGQGSGGNSATGTWGNPSANITGTWLGSKK
jgi:hypothetical protein